MAGQNVYLYNSLSPIRLHNLPGHVVTSRGVGGLISCAPLFYRPRPAQDYPEVNKSYDTADSSGHLVIPENPVTVETEKIPEKVALVKEHPVTAHIPNKDPGTLMSPIKITEKEASALGHNSKETSQPNSPPRETRTESAGHSGKYSKRHKFSVV